METRFLVLLVVNIITLDMSDQSLSNFDIILIDICILIKILIIDIDMIYQVANNFSKNWQHPLLSLFKVT